ncbi:translocation/assembly module TamB domain-containing protein [Parasphingorhabdus cellanae]|uniref:Translocation/assembly module TamB domain-containing protein n=1 Tax=Parasphingorhabdus cellanae TaxID=2806553 RepID=A0ABX7T6G2_9SPHN|nr:translocation/assembly module TamB domain-containing protein [Parasphingorhabdus cellanae]QTD55800.1 translocation/assembly module TamB domain-containing protein [Parasphingorhabdus cellanae]
MSEENTMPETAPSSNRRRKLVIGVMALLAGLFVAIVVGYIWLDSKSGHRFIAEQIEALEFESGMQIGIGQIEGSIYDEMAITDLTISDTKGIFASSARVEMDWRPFAFIASHVDVRSLIIPEAKLLRLPEFKETPVSDEPLLPDLDIDIDKLEIGELDIAASVTGERHLVTLSAKTQIADRRAIIDGAGEALSESGVAGGDKFAVKLNAVPEDNELGIAFNLDAPENGLVAGLTGVGSPMVLELKGQGDWARWNGTFKGSSGEDILADLTLLARDGTLKMLGDTRPGLLIAGQGKGLFEPATNIDLTASGKDRKFDLEGQIANDNFSLTANGLVDLGNNRMRDLNVEFRLQKPSTIADNLNGSGVVATLLLDGDFATPSISYAINAARLGFDQTTIIGLRASGSAEMADDQWRIPLNARAKRIAGLDTATGELLNNVRIDGEFAYANARILADDLKIRSDRIDASAVIVADLNTGLYTGGLEGRINGYRVESVGNFNIDSEIDLESGDNGQFALKGTIRARSSRIFNDGAREFLGGNSLIVANVSYGSDGVARINNLRAAAPSFRLTQGSGSYNPSGAISFSADGMSDQYGPLGVRVSGTVARPVARVLAARPGLSVGLANVTATIRGSGSGYAVLADGNSDYGPFDANVDVLAGSGPLTIDVNRGTAFAGVGLTGRIRQTGAGPFAGQLAANGSGIEGDIALSAFEGRQRAVVDATALNTELPGPAGLAIQRAIIDAEIILYDEPQLIADAQLEGLRMQELQIAAARAKIDYRGGQGTAKIMAEGRNVVPFRVAANATLAPKLWRIALDGRANGVDFKTDNPARIIPEGNQYTLLPTTINLSQGNIQLAGDYGNGLNIQSRLTDVNLALINPMMPGLGLGGTATGSLDFAQDSSGAFPSADARLRIDNFTRTSLAAVSQPVDMHFVGRLLADGGNARAIFRRRGAAIGRMQINLTPLPPGAGPWTTRLLAAPLSGGVRYNGPASTLFSLAALPDQDLTGAIGVAADFSGRVQSPTLTGVVRANNLIYQNNQYGTKLTNMRLRGNFTNDRLEVTTLTAQAGEGTISGQGFVSLSSDQGFPIQLALDLDNAQLAEGSDLAASATGQIQIVNNPSQPATITGRIRLPETRYKIVREGSTQVAILTGIRRKPALGRKKITGDPDPVSGVPSNWILDIDLVADNQIYVSGMGLDSEWAADIQVRGTTGAPVLTGGINLVRGNLGFAGRSFKLTEGRLRFNGGSVTNPTLRIVANGEADDVTINVNITGNAENPQIAFSSTPSLPQDEIMARILFGNSVGELSPIQAVQLAGSLNSLRGGSGGLNPLGVLQSSVGIDRLRVLGADEDTGRGTSIAAGQYISNDVYVEIITDTRGYTATQLEISLTPALSVLSSVGSFGGSNVNVRYRKDY